MSSSDGVGAVYESISSSFRTDASAIGEKADCCIKEESAGTGDSGVGLAARARRLVAVKSIRIGGVVELSLCTSGREAGTVALSCGGARFESELW